MKPTGYDFAGWASKANLKCGDGLTISPNAFAEQDGEDVPLVYMHNHEDLGNVIGHAILENRSDGTYCYGYLNDTPNGINAKKALKHGDLKTLSVWANNLVKDGTNVVHGIVREVSLCLAGQNPGARIESVMAHGVPMDKYDDEGIIYTGLKVETGEVLEHAVKDDDEEDDEMEKPGGKTVGEVMDTLTDEQKAAVAIILDAVTDDDDDEDYENDDEDDEDDEDYDEDDEDADDEDYDDSNDSEEGGEMKHNSFEGYEDQDVLSHGIDFDEFLKNSKREGSMREYAKDMEENGEYIAHAIPAGFPTGSTVDTTGFTTSGGEWRADIPEGRPVAYGFNDPELLFPDAHNLNTTPEWISRNMEWVSVVLNGVKRSPFSRIKTQFADITMEEARAKGYTKTHEKTEELFRVLKRVTRPTTVYKKQRMDRDDIIDITDFDVVNWIKAEMRVMLNEELARAILFGDGRPASSPDKIDDGAIRPIIFDDPLMQRQQPVKVAANATDEEKAKEVIRTTIKSRKYYKGSGNPIMFTTEDWLTEMLLLEDGIGHKLYKSESEVATALRVSKIVTVELMEGMTIPIATQQGGSTVTVDKPIIGLMVNLNDYTVGADKGGAIATFEDFDIDFNQEIYLMETRCSGALTKPYSAITLYLDQASAG